VSARTVSKHALSIYNDHSDVMACRQTGMAMLCSSNAQEVMDLGFASHLTAVKSRIPFLHFFDGYRTSAEIRNINVITNEQMRSIYPYESLQKNVRNQSLNPNNPKMRGLGNRPDIYFQGNVANLKYHLELPKLLDETFYEIELLTGRK